MMLILTMLIMLTAHSLLLLSACGLRLGSQPMQDEAEQTEQRQAPPLERKQTLPSSLTVGQETDEREKMMKIESMGLLYYEM
jgi:outer membrane biogenesis lipoprotein LolB